LDYLLGGLFIYPRLALGEFL
jgi:hypothetical protein